MQHGRDLTVQHMGNNADYDVLREVAPRLSERAGDRHTVLLLPTYPGYGEREVSANVELIQRYFQEQATRHSTSAVAAGERRVTDVRHLRRRHRARNPKAEQLLGALFRLSESRGKEASGLAGIAGDSDPRPQVAGVVASS